MRAHGVYLDESGNVIAENHISLVGWQAILKSAFRTDQPLPFVAGLKVSLCRAVVLDPINYSDIEVPDVGVNGYADVTLASTLANWTTVGTLDSEAYIQTKLLTWTPTTPFNKPSNRFAIWDPITSKIISVSGTYADIPANLAVPKSVNYRIYVR